MSEINGVFLFSIQEPYMEGVNPFIKNNKHRMIMFLDELGVGYLFSFPLDIIGTLRYL
jgi:hypothetical protein